MKNYDFKLARTIIEKFTSLTEVESVSMGMQEDWFWTADTVWENGEFKKPLNEETEIGGIQGSGWATPVIQVDLVNGESHVFNCYQTDGEPADILKTISNMAAWSNGCLSGPVTEHRLNIEVKDFKDNG